MSSLTDLRIEVGCLAVLLAQASEVSGDYWYLLHFLSQYLTETIKSASHQNSRAAQPPA